MFETAKLIENYPDFDRVCPYTPETKMTFTSLLRNETVSYPMEDLYCLPYLYTIPIYQSCPQIMHNKAEWMSAIASRLQDSTMVLMPADEIREFDARENMFIVCAFGKGVRIESYDTFTDLFTISVYVYSPSLHQALRTSIDPDSKRTYIIDHDAQYCRYLVFCEAEESVSILRAFCAAPEDALKPMNEAAMYQFRNKSKIVFII